MADYADASARDWVQIGLVVTLLAVGVSLGGVLAASQTTAWAGVGVAVGGLLVAYLSGVRTAAPRGEVGR